MLDDGRAVPGLAVVWIRSQLGSCVWSRAWLRGGEESNSIFLLELLVCFSLGSGPAIPENSEIITNPS